MRHKVSSITQLLRLPAICDLCQQYHTGRLAVCHDCITLLTPLGPACHYCAQPLPDAALLVCGRCCQKKPDVDTVMTAYCFEEPLRSLLHRFKYHEGLHLLSFLTTLMLQALPTTTSYRTDCLIPVPMHTTRLRQRGFNQAAELTKQLSRHLQIPYDFSYCKKIINTAAQARLSANERQNNLQRAFQITPSTHLKHYPHVTLIDDLMTTGSTVNELARVLKRHGVQRVDVWCCARVAYQ